METDRLRYFCTIYETQSISKASELLGVSHSGLSKAMTLLQDELGMKLFRPAGRGIETTDDARAVYEKSRQILELVSRFHEPTQSSSDVLRIGMAEILAHSLTREIARTFSKIRCDVFELDAGEIEISLLENRIDFGVSFIPFPRPELEYLKVAKATFGAFKLKGAFPHRAPHDLPFVIPASFLPTNPLSLKIRDGWPSELARKTPFRSSSLQLALEFVHEGEAAIFIPHFLASYLNKNRNAKLEEIPYPAGTFSKSTREIFIVKKKNAEESAPIKSVARALRLICRTGE